MKINLGCKDTHELLPEIARLCALCRVLEQYTIAAFNLENLPLEMQDDINYIAYTAQIIYEFASALWSAADRLSLQE